MVDASGITRRRLLAGLGATAATSVAAGAEPAESAPRWDITTDVLVAGLLLYDQR